MILRVLPNHVPGNASDLLAQNHARHLGGEAGLK